jgi:hypothetical protein
MIVLFLIAFFTTAKSNAQIPGLSGYYSSTMVEAQNYSVSNYPIPTKVTSCEKQLMDISSDGELSIFIAFGYLDFSLGQDFVNSENSYYTFGDVLDLDARKAFESALKQNCSTIGFDKNAKTTACKFSKSSGLFTKNIVNKFTGKNLKVKIKIVSSAYSSNDTLNKTTYASQQKTLSQNSETAFVNALQNYDVVIYLGHARSGGGPDFYPPVLLKNGKVDYPFYKKNKPGLSKMLGGLNTASDAKVLGVLACKSTSLFGSSIQSYAPDSLLVTADNLFDFDKLMPTGFSMVEALVSQRCTADFDNVLQHQLPSNYLTIKD